MSMTIAEAFEARGFKRKYQESKIASKTQIAINMLKHNMPVELIAELTQLDINLIIKLNQDQGPPAQ